MTAETHLLKNKRVMLCLLILDTQLKYLMKSSVE